MLAWLSAQRWAGQHCHHTLPLRPLWWARSPWVAARQRGSEADAPCRWADKHRCVRTGTVMSGLSAVRERCVSCVIFVGYVRTCRCQWVDAGEDCNVPPGTACYLWWRRRRRRRQLSCGPRSTIPSVNPRFRRCRGYRTWGEIAWRRRD
jgi:hypothetical protein